MELPKNRLTKCDIIVILMLLAVIIGFTVSSFDSRTAQNFVIRTTDKNESHSLGDAGIYSIVSNGICVEIQVENRSVSVISSDCPDQICVNSKMISRAGESIVCVPAKLVIQIPSDSIIEENEDFIIR